MIQNLVETARFCTSCGKEFQKGANYCAYCGAAFSPATPVVTVVAASVVSDQHQAPIIAPRRDSSFFSGWGKARKPLQVILWVFVLAIMFEEFYYALAGSIPPTQRGPGMIVLGGILAATYAPKRRYFGVVWCFLGVIGCILALGILNALGRLLR